VRQKSTLRLRSFASSINPFHEIPSTESTAQQTRANSSIRDGRHSTRSFLVHLVFKQYHSDQLAEDNSLYVPILTRTQPNGFEHEALHVNAQRMAHAGHMILTTRLGKPNSGSFFLPIASVVSEETSKHLHLSGSTLTTTAIKNPPFNYIVISPAPSHPFPPTSTNSTSAFRCRLCLFVVTFSGQRPYSSCAASWTTCFKGPVNLVLRWTLYGQLVPTNIPISPSDVLEQPASCTCRKTFRRTG